MKVAIISPTAHLTELSNYRNNNYCLALAQRVLTDPLYQKYYLDKSHQNSHLILDNGACELGQSISPHELIQACHLINPHTLVLPDILNDGPGTINLIKNFLSKYQHLIPHIQLMAVVQGKTKHDWLESLNQINQLNSIDYIGISNTNAIFDNQMHEFSRVQAIKWLTSKKLISPHKKIHLLGLSNSGHLEIEQLRQYSFVEGVDTNGPIVHAYYGIKFIPGQKYTKIRSYLPPECILTQNQITLAQHNISTLFESANYYPELNSK